jgi:hypothetical protein
VTVPKSKAAVGHDLAETARLADRIAEAVSGVPGVARLTPGPVATYLPGRIVPGVAVRDGEIAVSIVARYGRSLVELAEQVRAATRRVAQGMRVEVMIDDVEVEGS